MKPLPTAFIVMTLLTDVSADATLNNDSSATEVSEIGDPTEFLISLFYTI